MTKTKDQQAQEYVLNRQAARHNAKPEEEATMADFDKTRKAWDAYDMEQAFEDGYTACEQSMWRSVEEELPEDGETVLLSINGSRLTGYYSHDDELWEVDGIGAYERNDVYHWCKLPSLPDTNTENI